MYRALYIANQLGIEAYGVASDQRQYIGAGYIKNTVDFKLMEIKLKKWNEENK